MRATKLTAGAAAAIIGISGAILISPSASAAPSDSASDVVVKTGPQRELEIIRQAPSRELEIIRQSPKRHRAILRANGARELEIIRSITKKSRELEIIRIKPR
ncbi:MAG: hypothetical protein L0K86_08165 [Actinomycetia bacterium]|nr:hypothetical protein [Actinomycetes bacterium]